MTKKIKITINRASSKNSAAMKIVPFKEKGIIRRNSKADYLPRRKKNIKGIRFFDLGRLATGADVKFLFQPDFEQNANTDPIPFVACFQHPQAFAARDSFLLAMIEGNNFESIFYEIKQSDGDFYKIAIGDAEGNGEIIDSSSERWRAGGGLDLNGFGLSSFAPAYENITDYNSVLFDLVSLPLMKITSEFDFDGDGISDFSFSGNESIFWFPSLPTFRCYSSYGNSPNNQEAVLGNDFRFGLRNYFLADQTPDVNPNNSEASIFEPVNYEKAYQAIQYHVNLSDARAFHRHYDSGSGQTTWNEIAPNEILPNPPFTPDDVTSGNFAVEAKIVNFTAPVGALIAIVKRGNNMFYIWNNNF